LTIAADPINKFCTETTSHRQLTRRERCFNDRTVASTAAVNSVCFLVFQTTLSACSSIDFLLCEIQLEFASLVRKRYGNDFRYARASRTVGRLKRARKLLAAADGLDRNRASPGQVFRMAVLAHLAG